MIPLLLHTPGEPAGIGPELLVKLAQQASPACRVAVCDKSVLLETAHELGLPLKLRPLDAAKRSATAAGELYLQDVPLAQKVRPGQPSSKNAAGLLQGLKEAADLAQQAHAAMVTGPLNKAVINQAGFQFSGHTEFIAEHCRSGTPIMMLASGTLRVALATTHLPLRAVPDAISIDSLQHCLRVLDHDLCHKFGINNPRIQICGLNPHAGEGGHLGQEEIDIIEPAIRSMQQSSIDAQFIGPVPADSAFTQQALAQCDAVLAMYHDQGLPTLKHAGFGTAVNVTLGLPIIRTSVDHGTAFDIAGRGQADIGSLQSAENLALELSHQRRLQHG